MDLNYVELAFTNEESLSCLTGIERIFQVINEIKAVVEKAGGKAEWVREPSLHFYEDNCRFSLDITLKNTTPQEAFVKPSSEGVA